MKIVTSDSSHDAYFRVLDDMKAKLRSGGKLVVIAPDRFTASVERGLLLTLGEEGSFDVEVMSFTRMADRYVGSRILKCLTPEGSVMLISRVIDECLERGELSYYGKAAGREGFASELYAALTAIRNSGVSSDRLKSAADRSTSVALRRKLNDIVTIYKGYLAALEGRHSDSTTRLEQLAKYIKENRAEFIGTHYFCTDINEFSEPEYAVLEGLALNAGSLTIGIESGYGAPNARIYPDRVIKRLSMLTPDKVEISSFRDGSMSPALKTISERLFSYQPPEAPVENRGALKLRCAKDRGDEVLRLALDVIAGVRGGVRYKDFEVYVSDISDYESEIKSVFGRYGIPFFIDRRAPLTEQTKARFLLEAIACVRSGLAKREVLDFVKNPLFEARVDGGQDSVFKFENYVLEHNIDKFKFNYDFDEISQKRPLNCSEHADKTPNCAISPQESVRRALFTALTPLLDTAGLKGDKKAAIGEFTKSVRKLLEDCAQAAEEHEKKLATLSEYYKKCSEQVDKKLSHALDEIESVLGFETDISGFEGILKGMLRTLKISLVPTYLDCVFIGDSDSRFMGDGKLYVLGATNDKFPSLTQGGAVIGVRDEDALSALGVPIVPSSRQKAYAEMFKALDLIKKPRKGAVISFPESGGTGTLRRSTVIDELLGLIVEDGKPLKIERIDFSSLSPDSADAEYLLATPKSASFNAISLFGRAGVSEVAGTAYRLMRDEDECRINFRALPPTRVKPPKFAGYTSVSRLETFFACPYKHYMQYFLALKKRKEGELLGTENGTILHFVLQRFFEDVKADEDRAENERKFFDGDGIKTAAYAYFDLAIKELGFGDLLADPKTARTLLRVKEESAQVCAKLYEIQKRSDFKPFALEQKIDGWTDLEFDVGGDKIKFRGTIDRVDVYDDNFIIIDYKSYKSADLTLNDVYCGKKLQLYIYMYATQKATGLKPAGVFYMPIYVKFDEDGASRYLLKGHASDDMEMLAHMDSAFGKEGAWVQLQLSRGKIDKTRHFSEEGFELLGEYSMRLAEAGAREIANGYIKPSPIEKCDEHCDYYEICAFRRDSAARKCKAPALDKFLSAKRSVSATDGENDGGNLDE